MTGDLIEALAALARGSWSGTAAALLDALPPDVRPPGANHLAHALRADEDALRAAGVTVTAKRQGGTGKRLLALALMSENRPGKGASPIEGNAAECSGRPGNRAVSGPSLPILQPSPQPNNSGDQRGCNAKAGRAEGEAEAELTGNGVPGAADMLSGDAECDDQSDVASNEGNREEIEFRPPSAQARARGAGVPPYAFGAPPAGGSWCSRCHGRDWWGRGEAGAWACTKCCPDTLAAFGGQPPPRVVTT